MELTLGLLFANSGADRGTFVREELN